MATLPDRTQIANADIARTLQLHLVKLGVPDTSWKADISQIVPGFGANFIYVSKDGNDAIAAAAPYMPFATFAAARTYLLTLSPTATNRPLLTALEGYWEEGIVLVNNVDYNLGNSVLELKAGSLATIDDNGIQCNCNVYGNATIIRNTAGTNGNGMRTSHANTNLTITTKSISSSLNTGINCQNGTQKITGDVSSTANIGVYCQPGGTQTIIGNVSSTVSYGAFVDGGTQNITGDVSSTVIYGAYCQSGTQNITGSVSSTGTDAGDYAAYCSGGTQTINGNISATGGIGALCGGGTQIINNSRIVTTGTNMDAVFKSGGTQILKNCTLIATGTGSGIRSTTAQNVLIYGACESNKSIHANITTLVGAVTVDSNVI